MTNNTDTTDVLNRLIAIHYRSLPRYLSYASPTWFRGDESAKETLALIAADHQQTADRLGEMVVDRDRGVDHGAFPMAFTGYHDLSFPFLLDRLIAHQEQDVARIEACVASLAHAPLERAIAEEALGAAKGHLESLRELKAARS